MKQAELPTDKSVSTFQTAPPQIRGQLMLRNICIGLVMRGRHKAKLKKGKTGLSGGTSIDWEAVEGRWYECLHPTTSGNFICNLRGESGLDSA